MSPRRARSHTWEADIVHGHVTAVVDVTELAVELLAQLPQTELTKMMRETSNPVVREAITPALAFQTRLVTWAADPDPNVRIKAIRNGLADEALLNKLATLDPDAGVRFIAADRLKILRVPKR
jgi:hypothetical protein